MKPEISIIVPVYNASATLDACVESVLLQDYGDYELILVDDGSTDGSGGKCLSWADRDARIKVTVKVNEGVSAARNKGLDVATGYYVVFLDSDDTLLPGALAALMAAPDEDLVVGGLVHVVPTCLLGFRNVPQKGVWTLDDVSVVERLLCEIYVTAPWSKRFKRSLIERHGIRFDRRMFYGEDTDFVYRYIAVARRFVTIKYAITRYMDCMGSKYKKYKMSFGDFKLLTDKVIDNIQKIEMMTGLQYSVTRKFHLEFATNVYFESLMYCRNYKAFYREIVSIRNDSSRFFVTTYKKKTIKWLALRSVVVAYIIFRIYVRFKG